MGWQVCGDSLCNCLLLNVPGISYIKTNFFFNVQEPFPTTYKVFKISDTEDTKEGKNTFILTIHYTNQRDVRSGGKPRLGFPTGVSMGGLGTGPHFTGMAGLAAVKSDRVGRERESDR